MRTPLSPSGCVAALIVAATQSLLLPPAHGQDSISNTVPVVSIHASVAETREPFCDPAICDAALPPPAVIVVSRRGGDLASELFVSLAFGGTATVGVDYPELPSVVSLRAGQASIELFVQPTYDDKPEGDEIVHAQVLPDPMLGPIERYRVNSERSEARVVIHDNKAPSDSVLSIEATRSVAEESSFPYRRLALRGRFTISRTGSTDYEMPVFIQYGGTATPGVDYPFLPFLVTLPPGTNRIDIEVVPTPDNLPEPIETVYATLTEGLPGGIPGDVNIDPAHASARVFIRDDGITTASLEITAPKEGAEFIEGAPIRIATTAIDLEGAITHVDFFADNRKIGESTINFFRAPDPGDPIPHEFEWRGAPAGRHSLTARALNTAGNVVTSTPIRIRIGPTVPVVSIRSVRPETFEPVCPPNTCLAPEPAPGVFVISRRATELTHPLKILLQYGGSALPRSDYNPLPEWVEIPEGQDSVELWVTARFDELEEGDETVVAALQPDPSLGLFERYRIDREHAVARIVIHDRTPPILPIVKILATDPLARESTDNATVLNTSTFVVGRIGPTNNPLEIPFMVGGTASNGLDYAAVESPLRIPAGVRRAQIVIKPLPDNEPERVETVVLTLLENDAAVPGYVLGRPRRAAAIIVDDDHPRPHCVRLPDGRFNLCVPMDQNQSFRVESSGNLKVWTPVCILPVNEGMAHYVDPDSPDLSHQFYRLVPVASDPED